MADRLAHPPDLALAPFVQLDLDHVSGAAARRGRSRAAVLELDALRRAASAAASGARRRPRAVVLGTSWRGCASRFASSPSLVSRIRPVESASSRRPDRGAARPRRDDDGRAAVGVAHRRDDARGLVDARRRRAARRRRRARPSSSTRSPSIWRAGSSSRTPSTRRGRRARARPRRGARRRPRGRGTWRGARGNDRPTVRSGDGPRAARRDARRARRARLPRAPGVGVARARRRSYAEMTELPGALRAALARARAALDARRWSARRAP